MNRIDSQASEVSTLILDSQISSVDRNSQIIEVALSALKNQHSLKRSLELPSEQLPSKRVKAIPSKEDSDEIIISYLKLETWRSEKNREELISTLVKCFRDQSAHLVLPSLGVSHLPNCLEKMSWVSSLKLKSSQHLSNLSVLTKLHNLRSLSLVGKTQNLSFLGLMPFISELSISYNPTLKNLSSLKNYSNLTSLNLHHNRNLKDLSDIKDLAKKALKNLDSLSLSGPFRDLSFLRALPFLQRLSISYNPTLKNLSQITHAPDLLELSLKKNKNLTSLYGIEPLIRLVKIDLSNSPISMLSALDDLPRLNYHTSQTHPLGAPIQKSSLGLLRMNVEDEALQRVNLRSFINSYKSIASWLERLTNRDQHVPMPIWKNPKTRTALSKHVLEILKTAQKDPVFAKEILFPLVDASMTSCSDRTLYYLNELIRLLELYKAKDLSDDLALPVFKKHYRLFLIKELARESAEKRNLLNEEIEVQLDFFKELEAKLPFLDAEHTGLDWIKAPCQEIDDARNKLLQLLESPRDWIRYLCLDPFWQKRLFMESPDLKEEFSRIEESKYEELEAILALSSDHSEAFKELEIRHNQKIVEVLGKKALKNQA